MRILLIPPKSNYPDPRPSLALPPQGIAYVAGKLRAEGHQVFGLNCSLDWMYSSPVLALEKHIRDAIELYRPDIMAIGGLSSDFRFIRDAIFVSRYVNPRIPIILGGGIVTHDPDYISNCLRPDVAIIGEAEAAVSEVLECIARNRDLDSVPNILYWRDGKPVYTPRNFSYPELESLPYPYYDCFDYEAFLLKSSSYQHSIIYTHTRPEPRIFPITMGRSCPHSCTFCSHLKGLPYRMRSIDNSIEEILFFYEKYEFNLLFVYDELFANKLERVEEFCEKIINLKRKHGVDFDWTCAMRVTESDRKLLRLMREAGCAFVGFGLESASQPVLKSMRKGITVQQIQKAIDDCREAGVGFQGNFIFGDPSENQSSIEETKTFYTRNCLDLMVSCGFVKPYPGSSLFDYCIEKQIIKNRDEYYERITNGDCNYNMSSMPETMLQDLVRPLLGGHEHLFKHTKALSAQNHNDSKETDGPFTFRQSIYTIEATCPHCDNLCRYVLPCFSKQSGMTARHHVFCSKCHRRYILDASELISTAHNSLYEWLSRHDSQIEAEICTPFIPFLCGSYNGYNFVSYHKKVYAVPLSLGPFDVTSEAGQAHPEVLEIDQFGLLQKLIDYKKLMSNLKSDPSTAVPIE